MLSGQRYIFPEIEGRVWCKNDIEDCFLCLIAKSHSLISNNIRQETED